MNNPNSIAEVRVAFVSYLRLMVIPIEYIADGADAHSQQVKAEVLDPTGVVFETKGTRREAIDAAVKFAVDNYPLMPKEGAEKWEKKSTR